MRETKRACMIAVSLWVLAATVPALGQARPWDVFLDGNVSAAACGLVNADNVKLVVLTDTDQIMLVSGTDLLLENTFVDLDGEVFVEDSPSGFIAFATDGDGLRSLWWVSLTGNVVTIDGFTGEPSETALFPSDFFGVACDACDFWDDPTVCAVPDDPDVPLLTQAVFSLCGLGTPTAMVMTLAGLLAIGFVRRFR